MLSSNALVFFFFLFFFLLTDSNLNPVCEGTPLTLACGNFVRTNRHPERAGALMHIPGSVIHHSGHPEQVIRVVGKCQSILVVTVGIDSIDDEFIKQCSKRECRYWVHKVKCRANVYRDCRATCLAQRILKRTKGAYFHNRAVG